MALVHGWTVLAHPLLLDQLEKLTRSVEDLARKRPETYADSANAKLLAALNDLIFNRIPQDPAASFYRQGKTLGPAHKHWFRAKFGNGRFRLFFRYNLRARIIIFAWVNDETTLRTYGSKSDAYAVFKSMLEGGNPPDDWQQLLSAASAKAAMMRLGKARDEADPV